MMKYRKIFLTPKKSTKPDDVERALYGLGFTEVNNSNWNECKLKGIGIRDYNEFYIEDICGREIYLYRDKDNNVYRFIGLNILGEEIYTISLMKIDDEYADYIANRTRKGLLEDLNEEFLNKKTTIEEIEKLQFTNNSIYKIQNCQTLGLGHTFFIDGIEVSFFWVVLDDFPKEVILDYRDILKINIEVKDIFINY